MKVNREVQFNAPAIGKELAEFIGKTAIASPFVKDGWTVDKKTLPGLFMAFMDDALDNDDGEAFGFCRSIIREGKATAGPLLKLWKKYDPRVSRFGAGEDQEHRMNLEAGRGGVLHGVYSPPAVKEKKKA